MTIINLLILIILAGFLLWVINAYVPMASSIKSLLNILVFVLVVIYILEFFHLIDMILPFPQLPRHT
jgi:hypothetical protein